MYAGWQGDGHSCGLNHLAHPGILVDCVVVAPAALHQQTLADIDTQSFGLTHHVAPLPTQHLSAGTRIDFTLFWIDGGAWDHRDHFVDVV